MKAKNRKKTGIRKTKLDPSLEETAKLGITSGRLINFTVMIMVVLTLMIFINIDLQDKSRFNSLGIGILINMGLISSIIIVMLYMIADIYISKGDYLCRLDNPKGYSRARKQYEKALKIDRRSKKAWTGKGLALRMISHSDDALREALRNHNRALEIDPEYSVALVNKGNVLFNLGSTDDAITFYNRALDLDPNYITGWVNKGELLNKLGKTKEAKKCLDMARMLTKGKEETSTKVPRLLGRPGTFIVGLFVLLAGLFISLGSVVHNTLRVFVNETSWAVYGPWDWSMLIIGSVTLVVGIILLMLSNMARARGSFASPSLNLG